MRGFGSHGQSFIWPSSLQAARKYGYVMLSRAPGKVTILTPHRGLVEYHVMHVLEFDSRRKCMSVIVREKGTDQVVLYTKGADSAIFSFLDHHSGLMFGKNGGAGHVHTLYITSTWHWIHTHTYIHVCTHTTHTHTSNV